LTFRRRPRLISGRSRTSAGRHRLEASQDHGGRSRTSAGRHRADVGSGSSRAVRARAKSVPASVEDASGAIDHLLPRGLNASSRTRLPAACLAPRGRAGTAFAVTCAVALVLVGGGSAWAADGGAAVEAADAGAGVVAPVDPDAPTVAAHVDRADAHVGDPIRLGVVAVAKTGVPVNLPGTFDLGPFSLLGREETSEQNLGDGRIRREFVLKIAAYEPGELQLPPIDVTYLGPQGEVKTVRTGAVAIKIASLIANEPEPALKDAATPVSVMEENRLPLYIGGAVLAAGLGALLTFFIVRKLRGRPAHRPGPPPRPAHEIALERLDRLGALGFLENADNRPFYFAVSEVIRDYLGGRYGFDSLEMTTDELIGELARHTGRDLASFTLGEIQGWLSACDLVKFAKISPTAAEARGALESAIRIVTATRPAPVATVAAPGGTAEARHA